MLSWGSGLLELGSSLGCGLVAAIRRQGDAGTAGRLYAVYQLFLHHPVHDAHHAQMGTVWNYGGNG
jgi:hypothetical protein